jgi:hypothetical protein
MEKTTAASIPEIDQWLKDRQARLSVSKTTVTPGGQLIDWIPLESQSSTPLETPPPQRPTSRVSLDPSKPTNPVRFDIGEQGPAGHVPVLRPDLSRFRSSEALEDVFRKRGGLRVNVNRPNKSIADPNPQGYFHATSSQTSQVYGCDAWLSVWDPKIDIPSSPGDDHSISQTWLQNYQTAKTHSIEAGWTVDHTLNGDLFPHLFIYYTTNSYASSGDFVGGYNQFQKGWIQVDSSIYPGIRLLNVSAIDGVQAEMGLKFQLYGGNWWLGVKLLEGDPWIWVGYYPAGLFAGGLVNFAQWVSFGGEVYSALANPCNTTDEMGSGRQAAGGYRRAAYQRNLHNQTNASGTTVNFNGVTEMDAAASDCPVDPYTIVAFMNSGSAWESYQYFGGPQLSFFFRVPTEGIWQWVDYGTMVDDGVHPWNPDFRYLLTGIVLADLAKYSSPGVTKELLGLAAKQIELSAKGIVTQINDLSQTLEE